MGELIAALKLISHTCETYDCIHCPLSSDDDCIITEGTPAKWNIQDEPVKKVILRY